MNDRRVAIRKREFHRVKFWNCKLALGRRYNVRDPDGEQSNHFSCKRARDLENEQNENTVLKIFFGA